MQRVAISLGVNVNKELNQMPQWIDKRCIYCGRKYPDTILNIEGVIHHHGRYRCLDVKDCNQARKKNY